ncbi:MAG: hypothetical protein M3Q69_02530 [Acidobacteriota bacterium]|nr:hypothetical protein [Acidobacteriota bacterium]
MRRDAWRIRATERRLHAKFEAACEYRKLFDLREASDLFSEFEPVD